MKLMSIIVICLFVYVSASTYFFGKKTLSSKMVHQTNLTYGAIPLKKRIKLYRYNGPIRLKIKEIACYDYKNSDASVDITEGGIGFNHVTLRLKSQRSRKLAFDIEIYD